MAQTTYEGLASKIKTLTTDSATWYDGLHQFLVQQKVFDNTDIKNPFAEAFTMEDWVNGIKEWIMTGLPEGKNEDLTRDIAIGDFNEGMEFNYATTIAKVDTVRAYNVILPATTILNAFSSDKNLAKFAAQRVEALAKAHTFYLMSETGKILSKSTGALLDITFDEDTTLSGTLANFTEAKAKLFLNSIREKIVSYQIASNEHTAFGSKTDVAGMKYSQFKYSAKMNSLTLYLNSKIYTMIMNLTSTLFNKEDILITGLKIKEIDFSKVKGITDPSKIGAFLIDNRALIMGSDVKKLTTVMTLPLARRKIETLYRFGFARIPIFPILRYKFA